MEPTPLAGSRRPAGSCVAVLSWRHAARLIANVRPMIDGFHGIRIRTDRIVECIGFSMSEALTDGDAVGSLPALT